MAEYWGGNLPWLTPSDVTQCEGLFIGDTKRHITESGLANTVAKLLPSGTVMMTSRATIGEVVINQRAMATNQGFINIVCDANVVNNEFLAYWIAQNKQVFVDRAHGVTFKEITKSNFKTVPIMLPPVSEQRAIARILRTVQDAILARRHELELERERKAALMQHLFTKGTRGEPTKQTEIGEIPESWQVVEVQDLLDSGVLIAVQDGNHGELHPKQRDFTDTGVPFLTADCIRSGQVLFDRALRLPEDWLARLRVGFAKPGDVLLTHKGNKMGEVALLGSEYSIVILTPQVTYYRVGDIHRLNRKFLLSALQSPAYTQRLQALASSQSTRRYVGITAQRRLHLPLPPESEQDIIANVLGACEGKLAWLTKESTLIDELFRALLEELVTGPVSATPLVAVESGAEVPA